MKMPRIARVVVLLLLLSPILSASPAEDLTGKWGGPFVVTGPDGQTHDESALMVAKHKGTELTGTIGPGPEEQFTIQKGKVETTNEGGKDVTRVTFDVAPDGGTVLIHVTLTLVDGHLKGNAKGEHDGQPMGATLDLSRIKN